MEMQILIAVIIQMKFLQHAVLVIMLHILWKSVQNINVQCKIILQDYRLQKIGLTLKLVETQLVIARDKEFGLKICKNIAHVLVIPNNVNMVFLFRLIQFVMGNNHQEMLINHLIVMMVQMKMPQHAVKVIMLLMTHLYVLS